MKTLEQIQSQINQVKENLKLNFEYLQELQEEREAILMAEQATEAALDSFDSYLKAQGL